MSGPPAPKEMGVILGVAVLLDTLLIRVVLLPGALAGSVPAGQGGEGLLHRLPEGLRLRHDQA
jgi:RND superfamily putative drug exporter